MTWKIGRMMLLGAICIVALSSAVQAAESGSASGRRVLAADYSKKRVAMLDSSGRILWQRKIEGLHDMELLPDGNILMQDSWTHVLEVTPGMDGAKDKLVWEYDSGKSNGNAGKKVEVHAFQRLPGGVTLIAESGPSRLIEVDHGGKIVHEMKLKVAESNPHRDTRLMRKLPNGHYLVCQEAEGTVREYEGDGRIVWEYVVPMFGHKPAPGHGPEAFGNNCFAALRLPNGNTLIATGNGHSVLEVTPAKEVVWKIEQNDLPGMQLAWVTTLQMLPNGNLIFGNCHATEANPQIIEVTRDKKVVWTFKDFNNFGNSTASSLVIDAK